MLDYGDAADEAGEGAGFLVVPRLGTISPWASKATEILRARIPDGADHETVAGLFTLELGRIAKEGDVVVFSKYGGTEVKYNNTDYLLLNARDILAVVVK